MQNKSETELIAQSLDGNHEAYGLLVDRYKNAIYHHCFVIVRDEDLAEDISQETFITAFYKLGLYRSEYKLSTWLFKIATNNALNALKKRQKELPSDEVFFSTIASSQAEPSTTYRDSELHEAVDKLEVKHRTVISLYYWQGLSYQEIAAVMSSPIGSVRGWMYRAKETLRKELS